MDSRQSGSTPQGGSESIRERILTAAFGAFAEKGFAQTSTLEIATLARVSKRELYSLFGSKQEMLVICISERGNRMRLPADWPVPSTRQDLRTGLVKFGTVLLHETTDPDVIAVFRLAISEAVRSPQIARALEAHGRQAARKALREILEHARSGGLLEGADPERMVALFMALLQEDVMLELALGVVKRPSPNEMRRRAAEATDAFLRLYPERKGNLDAAPRAARRRKAA